MRWDDVNLDEGPVPMWSQIADRLRRAIEDGTFKPGDALPGEAEINKRFGVSRSTSRAALDHLETEGLIKRRSGLGSIVIEPQRGALLEQIVVVLGRHAITRIKADIPDKVDQAGPGRSDSGDGTEDRDSMPMWLKSTAFSWRTARRWRPR